MKKVIIILGAGVMQGPAINIAKQMGLYTIVLDGSSNAPCITLADRFEKIDLKEKEEIESFAKSLQNKTNRLGIMTAGTDFSASVAWVAEKLQLPGIPYETALNASDKSRMRSCFDKTGLPSPPFAVISNESFLIPDYLQFPLVVKPVDNMGSRGCRRIDSIDEFEEAAKTAIGFSRSGRAIIESFMDGPEFSVDAIYYHGEITICGLADRHIFFPPYFIEMGHTMPTEIDEEKQKALLDTFCKGVKALGLNAENNIGAAKGDIKLTSKGAMIGEIAARLSGGYMSGWTYPYSSGVLPIKAAIQAAMGKKPDCLEPVKKWTCAERAFISIPGIVKEIIYTKDVKSIPYVNDLFFRIKEGDKVTFPENNVTKCGNIIASAQERKTAIEAAQAAACSVLIRLDPTDIETRNFLENTLAEAQRRKGDSCFPPDAFQITDKLREVLTQIPDEIIKQSNGNSVSPCLRVNSSFQLIPFPEFEQSGFTDYMGRTVQEVLDAVRLITGFSLPNSSENAENVIRLGRSFWAALIRGSYQGAVYYIDSLGL
ncbi:MAG: ATP-grasp domain-containing protein [Treponema sp.]|nr:ATP-grasp domain-containing protein [Treponema sp.]